MLWFVVGMMLGFVVLFRLRAEQSKSESLAEPLPLKILLLKRFTFFSAFIITMLCVVMLTFLCGALVSPLLERERVKSGADEQLKKLKVANDSRSIYVYEMASKYWYRKGDKKIWHNAPEVTIVEEDRIDAVEEYYILRTVPGWKNMLFALPGGGWGDGYVLRIPRGTYVKLEEPQ